MSTHISPAGVRDEQRAVDPRVPRAPRMAPARDSRADGRDIVEVWGRDSFPASDPPANW